MPTRNPNCCRHYVESSTVVRALFSADESQAARCAQITTTPPSEPVFSSLVSYTTICFHFVCLAFFQQALSFPSFDFLCMHNELRTDRSGLQTLATQMHAIPQYLRLLLSYIPITGWFAHFALPGKTNGIGREAAQAKITERRAFRLMPLFIRSRQKLGILVLDMMTLEHAASSDLLWGSVWEDFSCDVLHALVLMASWN